MDGHVLLAVVTGALGLKGEVKLKTFTADPDGLARYGVLFGPDGRRFEVVLLRPAKPGEAVAMLKGITGRTQAEALKGLRLFVPRNVLPAPDEDEFYHADLIGLAAHDGDGRLVGTVSAIHNFGAGDVIELMRGDGDSVHLAFTRHTVPVIDIPGGRITVAVPPDEDEGEDEDEDGDGASHG